MTNDEINIAIAELCGHDKFFGLKKHGLWYRPNARGYTSDESKAGRYTLEEAKAHEYVHGQDDDVTVHKFNPPNYTGSLDACREFEKECSALYWGMLYDVCNPCGALGCVDQDRTDT